MQGLVVHLKKDKLEDTFRQMKDAREAKRIELEERESGRSTALFVRMQDRLTTMHQGGWRKRQSECEALAS